METLNRELAKFAKPSDNLRRTKGPAPKSQTVHSQTQALVDSSSSLLMPYKSPEPLLGLHIRRTRLQLEGQGGRAVPERREDAPVAGPRLASMLDLRGHEVSPACPGQGERK